MGMMNNMFYSGPNPAAAGVSSFADNFLRTYLALKESGQRQQQVDSDVAYRNMMMQQQEADMQREAAYRSAMANLPIKSNMPGLMASGTIDGNSSDPVALKAAATGQILGMNMPTLEDQLAVQMQYEPDKAIATGASIENAEQRNAMRQILEQMKEDRMMKIVGEKHENTKELQGIKGEQAQSNIRLKGEEARKTKGTIPGKATSTGSGKGGGRSSGGRSGGSTNFEREYSDYVNYAKQYHPGMRVATRGEYKTMQAGNATRARENAKYGPTSTPQASAQQPKATTKPLDRATATSLLKRAGGDKEKARQLAKQMGYSF